MFAANITCSRKIRQERTDADTILPGMRSAEIQIFGKA